MHAPPARPVARSSRKDCTWICSSTARPRWSPAARRASGARRRGARRRGRHGRVLRPHEDDVEAAAEELRGAGGRTVAGTALDVADGDALAAWVAAIADRFGGIDVVVANVPALAIGPTEENWEKGFQVDLMHTVRLAEAALPHLDGDEGRARRDLLGVRPRDRLRQGRLRHHEGRRDPLRAGARVPARRGGRAGQRRLAGQHLLPRRGVGEHRDAATRTCSPPRWASTRPAGWRSPRRSPTRS